MLRIVLIPVFVAVFFSTPREQDRIAALVIFAVASITDMFDGMLARKLNQITDFGKLFDPLADKVMVITALIVVVYSNYVGKTAQVFFIASLLLSFFHPSLEAAEFRVLGMTPDLLLLWITVALSLAALAVYAAGALRTLKAKKEKT